MLYVSCACVALFMCFIWLVFFIVAVAASATAAVVIFLIGELTFV